jgi:hypothetical protein
MKRVVIWCLSTLLGVGMTICCGAVADGPYQAIVKRNAFNLKPVQEQRSEVAVPAPKFELFGITTILGDKRALIKAQFPGSPESLPVERSLILIQGQSDGEVEALEVDERRGSVKLRYAGMVYSVAFEEPTGEDSNSVASVPKVDRDKRAARSR